MAQSRSFLIGLKDFVTAPIHLWSVHRQLVRMNPVGRSAEQVLKHHLEHSRRVQLRSRLTVGSSASSTSLTSAHTEATAAAAAGSSVVRRQRHSSEPCTAAAAASLCTSTAGLLQPLVSMWIINVGSVLSLAILYHLTAFVGFQTLFSFSPFVSTALQFLSAIFSILLRIVLPLFMELVNMLYLKKICDQIAMLHLGCKDGYSVARQLSRDPASLTTPVGGASSLAASTGPSSTTSSTLVSTIMDRIYSLVFFIVFQLQWNLLSIFLSGYRLAGLVNVFAVAFLYACYAIEYRWRQAAGSNFEEFLVHTVDRWTYFVGYGFCLGVASFCLPEFIGWGGIVLSIAYPILVIGALVIHTSGCSSGSGGTSTGRSKTSELFWLDRVVCRLFQLPLTLSMQPALSVTNFVVRTSTWSVYHLWFESRWRGRSGIPTVAARSPGPHGRSGAPDGL